MLTPRTVPRMLQQQPKRLSDVSQQQAGSRDFNPRPVARREPQMGEGSAPRQTRFGDDSRSYCGVQQ